MDIFKRSRLLLGDGAMEQLQSAHVAVFGLGGVGGYVVEALCRSGIGALTLVDHDTISPTNRNRQILATAETEGMEKCQAAAQRALQINPQLRVFARNCFYTPETAHQFDFTQYDYVVDAIDTVTGKLMLITAAQAANVPIISCMGTGNKLDASKFQITDIHKTSVCPLARVMRKECKARGIRKLKVLFSTEDPIPASTDLADGELPQGRRALPGSVAWVPAVAGLMIAGEVVMDLTKKR